MKRHLRPMHGWRFAIIDIDGLRIDKVLLAGARRRPPI
jgi:hypothetical protein